MELVSLPNEILEIVFEFLERCDLLRASRVSYQLYRICTSCLYRSLTFSAAEDYLTSRLFTRLQHSPCVASSVRHLMIKVKSGDHFHRISSQVQNFMRCLNKLQTIDIYLDGNGSLAVVPFLEKISNIDVRIHVVKFDVRAQSHNEFLRRIGFSRLRSLGITYNSDMGRQAVFDDALHAIVQKAFSLERVVVSAGLGSGYRLFKSYGGMPLSSADLMIGPQTTYLEVANSHSYSTMTPNIHTPRQQLSNLKDLAVSTVYDFLRLGFGDLIRLESLAIKAHHGRIAPFNKTMASLKDLEALYFKSYYGGFPLHLLEHIGENLRSLTLKLYDTTKMSLIQLSMGEVENLYNRFPRIHSLGIGLESCKDWPYSFLERFAVFSNLSSLTIYLEAKALYTYAEPESFVNAAACTRVFQHLRDVNCESRLSLMTIRTSGVDSYERPYSHYRGTYRCTGGFPLDTVHVHYHLNSAREPRDLSDPQHMDNLTRSEERFVRACMAHWDDCTVEELQYVNKLSDEKNTAHLPELETYFVSGLFDENSGDSHPESMDQIQVACSEKAPPISCETDVARLEELYDRFCKEARLQKAQPNGKQLRRIALSRLMHDKDHENPASTFIDTFLLDRRERAREMIEPCVTKQVAESDGL